MFYIRSRCRWPNWPTRVCPWILACAAMMNLAAADSGSNIQKRKHWAFDPPVKTPPPRPQNADVGAHPVDCFLAVRRTAQQLPAAVEADRNTLIRRVTLDLTGLPPTLAEVATFTTDTAPEAYGRLITRLLNSPHYGEQMARFWLDLARYADTHGMHLDNERQMWAYRDWVVRSFNRNLSFDQFTIEQLAGDLLPHATTDQLTATGFNRCNVTSGEGGSIDAEYLFRYAVDRTSTTVQTWLGLTAGCAVCHDHKFDPISAKEFYSLLAFFGSAADPAMDGNILRTAPTVQLGTPETMRRLAEFDAQIKPAEAKLSTTYAGLSYTDPATLTPPPTAREDVRVWLDDEPVDGFKASSEPRWITAEAGPVFAGKRALRRQGSGVIQDVFEGAEARLTLPNRAVLFAEVFLDLANPPKTVMLQLNRDGWEHRALWGDPDTIPWGEKGQPSRALIGPLPQPGKWVHLEVSAEKIGLRPGDRIKGFAFTQTGGSVTWDRLGVAGLVDPANDPQDSIGAWLLLNEGKEREEVPPSLRKIFKETKATNRTPAQVRELREHYLVQVHAGSRTLFDPLIRDLAGLRKQRDEYNETIPQTLVWRDVDPPRETFVMLRGQYDRPGEKVSRGVPAILPLLHREGTNATRLDFARWLVSPEQPLTARVTVNRIWQQFFGLGLVKTSDDFGTQGQPPSHPELLDWLAVTFQESGWNMKELVRLLVTSAAYRQASIVTPLLLQRDPENRLLARGPRFRLDAEQLRDQALFVAGLLDLTMGGKGVKPYQPPNLWEPIGFVGSNTREYKQDVGSALYRRSLYSFIKRTAPPPFMAAFDAPNREQSCTRRERSNTPLQALQLLNDVQYLEAARQLAGRMLEAGGAAASERLRFGFKTVLARDPDAAELQALESALAEHLSRYERDPAGAVRLISFGDSTPSATHPPAELAAYTLMANLLLNLDEALTRN